MTDSTLEALRAGGKPAMARALALIERAPDAPGATALLDAAWADPAGLAIGLTGPPGVGKSTLLDALIRAQRARGRSVAIVAVDPSSKRSRGALLGDRARLATDPEDQGVFIRSMAARDRLGGLAALTYPAATLLRAVYDLTLIETVGVGQSETDVADVADATVFCAQPGSGDSLQFMKAGVMETPDLLLVTKADLGEPARRAAADAQGALSLAAGDGPPPPVRLVSAATGEGVAEALEEMAAVAQSDLGTRRAQAEAWIRQTLTAEGGRRALAAAEPAIAHADGAPFALRARLSRAIAAAFEAGLAAQPIGRDAGAATPEDAAAHATPTAAADRA